MERKQENPMRRQNNGANKLTNVGVEDGLVAADEQMERLVPNTDMATELKKDLVFFKGNKGEGREGRFERAEKTNSGKQNKKAKTSQNLS